MNNPEEQLRCTCAIVMPNPTKKEKRNCGAEALEYHGRGKPGKLSVIPTKPCMTAAELSLAYTPGVARPCLEIARHSEDAYLYTGKGNLVAVVSNGTAVLGLGNIGSLAGKPVMEGKAVLFKRFANIDAFDIEINETDPEKLATIIASLEPTFGGINLEDIRAPDCFVVEERLQEHLKIPVFHDDQHGTAVIVSAALLNALKLQGKKPENAKIVFSGAGAAAIACAGFFLDLGIKKDQITLCDSEGVISTHRMGLNRHKARFARKTLKKSLTEVLAGADIFIGLSKGNILTPEMVGSMAGKPIVFAMANPVSEIGYAEGRAARPDIIIATGRSDYPNQVNNVLGFPFIFRGALDVRATQINLQMKMAAAKALAALAYEPVPEEVSLAYGTRFQFGPDYIIPKIFDSRILYHVAPAVAKAAMETGAARKKIDLRQYTASLKELAGELAKGKS